MYGRLARQGSAARAGLGENMSVGGGAVKGRAGIVVSMSDHSMVVNFDHGAI
jgi:FAD/FMN-containing dehydrogenase